MQNFLNLIQELVKHDRCRGTFNKSTRVLLMSVLVLLGNACSSSLERQQSESWLSVWSTAPQLVEPHNVPPAPGLSNNTLRQIVQVSQGGQYIRVKFSNEFSSEPVTLKAVQIAKHLQGGKIDPSKSANVTFAGKSKITMIPGAAIFSDPINFLLKADTTVAISIHFGDTSKDITGHPGSRTTSYIGSGNTLGQQDMTNTTTTDHWYVITGIDTQISPQSDASTLVVIGDSISDGRGSGTNKQNRWPDALSRRLLANPATQNLAVVNQGIGGNCVLRSCLGPSAVSRFERDVLNQSGVRWLIIFEGINDVGGIKTQADAEKLFIDITEAYQNMIKQAHETGIKVYGATLMPFADSFYDSPEREYTRSKINDWIRTSGKFDAVIDFDKALAEPNNPKKIIALGDTSDHLHPNEAGHRLLAEAVDLSLFEN